MALYFYNKYNADATTTYKDPTSFVHQGSTNLTAQQTWGYPSYSFSSSSGFTGSGTAAGYPTSPGQSWYVINSPISIRQYQTTGYNPPLFPTEYWDASCTAETTYSKGSLIESNIIAEDGTYPADGRHTDGYWYVKGDLVPQVNAFFFGMNF